MLPSKRCHNRCLQGFLLEWLFERPRELNNGDVVTFARRVPPGAEEDCVRIVETTGSLVASLRQASLSLQVVPDRDEQPNSVLLKVWERRLQWEVGS